MYKIYDIINNTYINLKLQITEYDSDLDIKNKIFLSIKSDDEENLFRYYTENIIISEKNKEVINIYSSYDDIYKNLFNFGINFNTFISIDDPFIKNLYLFIKKNNPDISENVFLINVQYIIGLILQNSLSEFLIDIKSEYIKSQETLNSYYVSVGKFDKSKDNLSKIFYLNEKGQYKYNILSCVINIHLFEDTKNKNVNLLKLFKKMELSENIPYIYLINDQIPYLKLYSDFSDKTLIKSWIVNKSSNLKASKGLNFKYKINGKFYHCNLYENGILSIIINSKIEDNTVSEEILSYITNKMGFLYSELGKYYNIPDNPVYMYRFNYHFYINMNIELYKLILSFQKHPDFTLIPSKNQDKMVLLKLKYKDMYFISINQLELDGVINYSTVIQNITDFSMINTLQSKIGRIFFDATLTGKSNSANYFKSNEKIIKSIKQKSVVNIKKLRKEGLNVNAVSCQRIRQPIIVSKGSLSKHQNVKVYNDKNYTCPKKDYPYLGVTVDNTLCCFKKSQENKDIYKRFFSSTKNFKPDYSELQGMLSKRYIIKTNKVLDYGRLGTIPIKYSNLKMDKLLRLGNYQNYHSFINIINILTKKTFKIDDISESLYKIEDNGNVAQNMSYNSYKNILKYNSMSLIPLNHSFILESACSILKINVVIISSDKIDTCISNDKYKYYIILLYKNSYEGIIKNNEEFHFDSKDQIINNIKNLSGFLPSRNILLNIKQLMYNTDNENPLYQIVNNHSKVIYLYYKNYGLIPVIPSASLINIKCSKIENIKKFILKPSEQYHKNLNFINKYPNLKSVYSIDARIFEPASNVMIGYKLKNGLNAPVIQTVSSLKKSSKLKTVYENIFYNLIDTKQQIDDRIEYIIQHNYISELYQRLRFIISENVNSEHRKEVLGILNTKFDSVFVKSRSIQNLLIRMSEEFINKVSGYSEIPLELDLNRKDCPRYFCNAKNKLNIKESDFIFFIQKIANELINGNLQVIDKTVPIEIENKDNLVIRKNEIVLIKEQIINKYFKNKKFSK